MFFRWMFGLPFAALVTAALFFMMSGMIRQEIAIGAQNDPPKLKIVPEIEDSQIGRKREKPPKLTENPPKTAIPPTLPGPRPNPGPRIPDERGIDPTPIGPGQYSAPVIRYAPQYPEACRSRGAQGDVLVRFDVTPEGNVVNIRILNSADPCFNRTVRNTVAQWKFPPVAGGGMRVGMLERFSFQLVE